jgi:surface polysaccharide O-acyltransferase-like enzyme
MQQFYSPSLDALRLLSLFGVVVLHQRAEGILQPHALTNSFDALARVSVPLFFLISGFLWKERYAQHALEYVRYAWRRILLPFAVWFLLYNYDLLVEQWNPDAWKYWRKLAYHFFLKGGAGYHLWFLPALFCGSLLLIAGKKWLPKFLLPAGILLYAAGSALEWQSELAVAWYRNGLFFSPLFLVLGNWAAKRSWPRSAGIWLTLVGGGLHFYELFAGPEYSERILSVGLPFFCLGIFLVAQQISSWPVAFCQSWGQHVYGAFFSHLLLLKLFKPIPLPAIVISIFVFVGSLWVSRLGKHLPLLRRIL